MTACFMKGFSETALEEKTLGVSSKPLDIGGFRSHLQCSEDLNFCETARDLMVADLTVHFSHFFSLLIVFPPMFI